MNGGFRTLWSARVLSYAGDSISLVALMLYVADTTGQALAVSVLLLAGEFVPALISPLTGAISDRFGRKPVMVACELIQGAVVLAIAFTLPPLPILLVLVAVRATASQVFQPASRAVVPALVEDAKLEKANSAIGFGTNGAEAIGPLVAAVLLPTIGIRGALLVDAATFLLSALLLATLRSTPRPEPAAHPSIFREAAVGLRHTLSVPLTRVVVIGFCVIVAFNGIDDVALVLLAKDDFRAGDSAVALLLAGVGIGLLAGYLLLTRLAKLAPMAVLLVVGFAVSSLGNLFTAFGWAVAAVFVMQTVRGVGIAAMDVAANTLLQRNVPAEFLGRVFGNLYGGIGIAAALSYIGGGFLLDATSPRFTFVVVGVGGVIATAAVALSLWSRRR